jgi:nonsense-mediated mRNA decay protein 3
MASKCPQCGRPSVGVCIDCYTGKYPFGLRRRRIKACKCGRVFLKDREYKSFSRLLEDYLIADIMAPPGVDVKKVRVKSVEGEKIISVNVEVEGAYKSRGFRREHAFKIKPFFFSCDVCSQLAGGYYEAVLQVRAPGFKPKLEEEMVTKVVKATGGVDYYIRSREYAKAFAHDLRQKGFFVTTSSKLLGRKEGRRVYRVYYAVKRPGFEVGDVVEYKGKFLLVLELGKHVKLIDLESRKRRSVKLRELEGLEAYARPPDFRRFRVTAVRRDGIQVMDLDSYEVYEVPARGGVQQGEEVKALLVGNRVILL